MKNVFIQLCLVSGVVVVVTNKHISQVENRGPSNIEQAEVYILWPSHRQVDDPLLYLTAQPQIEGPGKCQFVVDVNTHNIKVSCPCFLYQLAVAARNGSSQIVW